MGIIILLFSVAVATAAVAGAAYGYLVGSRKGVGRALALREAIALVQDRGRVAVDMAPAGNLALGLARARMAHDIEMDLRVLLTEARARERIRVDKR